MTTYINATASNQVHSILGPGTAFNTEVTNVNGNVVIDTRLGNDDVRVSQHGFMVTVTVNGVSRIDIDTRKARSITINGGAGNDHIHADPNVSFPLTLMGGSGNDHIDGLNVGHNHVYGGDGFDQIHAKATDHVTYGNFLQVIQGGGTLCVPTSQCADVAPPPQTYPHSNQPQEAPAMTLQETQQIQDQWNRVVQQSLQQSNAAQSQHDAHCADKKTEDLVKILEAALAAGNIDLAMLLLSSLETRQANEVAGKLLGKIRKLQDQRKEVAQEIGQLGKEDGGKATELNIRAGDIGTEIQMFQTFLQDIMAQKNEAQQMASNYLKSKHDTAQSIIRNIA